MTQITYTVASTITATGSLGAQHTDVEADDYADLIAKTLATYSGEARLAHDSEAADEDYSVWVGDDEMDGFSVVYIARQD